MTTQRATFAILAVAGAGAASAWACDTALTTERVAFGLVRPLYVTAPVGDTSRVFIVEQRSGSIGRIRILNIPANTLNATPYLSVSPVSTSSEQGLLGLAFHPDFLNNGYFFVNYTRTAEAGISAGSTIIARYQANAPYATSTTANAASAVTLLTIPQPDSNHNGGWLAFGPDGYLYTATGDGGCANDTTCVAPNPPSAFPHVAGGNAQDLTANLLGKMLRLDVDGLDNIPGNDDDDGVVGAGPAQYTSPPSNPFVGLSGDDEIFAWGLRNPWRPCFDRENGDIYIADVGQNTREEVNYVPAGTLSGRNFGWRCMEGLNCTGLSGCTCNAASLTLPVYSYDNNSVGVSVTGGCVYRGSRIPDLHGTYFVADFGTNPIWTFRMVGGVLTDFRTRTAQLDPVGALAIGSISSFGEDASGEMYICDLNGGEVFKVIPNGVITGDMNNDGSVNFFDIDAFLLGLFDAAGYTALYGISPVEAGDVNCDTTMDFFDIDPWLAMLFG